MQIGVELLRGSTIGQEDDTVDARTELSGDSPPMEPVSI